LVWQPAAIINVLVEGIRPRPEALSSETGVGCIRAPVF